MFVVSEMRFNRLLTIIFRLEQGPLPAAGSGRPRGPQHHREGDMETMVGLGAHCI